MFGSDKELPHLRELKEKTCLSDDNFTKLFCRSLVELCCDMKGATFVQLLEVAKSCNYDADFMFKAVDHTVDNN